MNRRIFAGLLLCAACGREVVAPSAPLAAGVEFIPSTFRVGDTVTVVVTVVNRGAEAVNMEQNQCPWPFVIMTSRGAVVGPSSELCLAYTSGFALQPRAAYSWTMRWSGRGSAAESTPALKPGEYVVAPALFIPPPRSSGDASGDLAHIQVLP
jgi:hypothetical protein